MLIRQITEIGIHHPRLLPAVAVFAYKKLCASNKPRKVCPSKRKNKDIVQICKGRGSPPSGPAKISIVRAQHSGPCRFGFIPEEWFLFLHSKTGVTGPYFLMIGIANYLASKEIYVMEHEYYSGLSVAIICYLGTTRLGPVIGAYLDKEVDAAHDSFQITRDNEIAFHNNVIKEAQLAQTRAKAQKELMAAKKENIALQLEAIFRERSMLVYKTVRNRLDYHVKRSRTQTRIHNKWMYQWIMSNVYKAITPEFKKQAMKSALAELTAVSQRVKK